MTSRSAAASLRHCRLTSAAFLTRSTIVFLNGQEATLADGTVSFNLANGFLPTAGQQITFITANGGVSLTGETTYLVENVDNSFEFDVVENGNNLAFSAITDAVAGTGTVVVGGSGDEDLMLSAGDDAAQGNGGNDSFQGLGGNDTLDGGRGNDTLSGGAGNDILIELTGNDTLDGGAGIDTVDYSALGSAITVDLRRAAEQTISAAGGNDMLSNIENVVGGRGGDRLLGSSDNNTLEGIGGNDTLVGFDGDDILLGGLSNDVLSGGNGDDTLDGGAGRDIFNGGAGEDAFHLQ